MSNEKAKLLNDTKFIIDDPKKGYITKVYPTQGDNVKLPYKTSKTKKKEILY